MSKPRNRTQACRTAAFALAAALFGSGAMAQSAPSIDAVHWPWIGSYCSFFKEGHEFHYDDLDSWQFVFFTEFPERDADLWGRAFMRIDGQLRELSLISFEARGGSETYAYRTHDDPPYTVTVAATPGEQGYESLDFTGSLTVARGGAATEQAFYGDCGV